MLVMDAYMSEGLALGRLATKQERLWVRAVAADLEGTEVLRRSGLYKKSFLVQIVGGLRQIFGAAEVAPIVVVGAEGEDVLSLSGEAQVGVDDGENALFGEHREKARRDDVDTGEGECLKGR